MKVNARSVFGFSCKAAPYQVQQPEGVNPVPATKYNIKPLVFTRGFVFFGYIIVTNNK